MVRMRQPGEGEARDATEAPQAAQAPPKLSGELGEAGTAGEAEKPLTIRDDATVRALLRAAKGMSRETPALPL